jgi:hypothetical protein
MHQDSIILHPDYIISSNHVHHTRLTLQTIVHLSTRPLRLGSHLHRNAFLLSVLHGRLGGEESRMDSGCHSPLGTDYFAEEDIKLLIV